MDEYKGLIGFGFSREVDEFTVTYYLQKFADDEFMELLRPRMSQEDLKRIFDFLTTLMKKYLTEKEYHRYFLKEKDS